ncbi:MAG: amidohydrolase family protein [Myxococcota bacterium]
MTQIIDADTHLMEPATVYLDHIDPRHRDEALVVECDDRGWPWLTHRGNRLFRIDSHTPGHPELIGEQQRRYAEGGAWQEAEHPIADPWQPTERIANLIRNEVDASILFPNLGLGWGERLSANPQALFANLAAYNTWLLELLPVCEQRLFPAATLSLRDLDWFCAELDRVAKAGCKLAMISPAPVDGRALAHPDFDRAWAAIQDHDMTLCFHVSNIALPLDPAWYALDPEPANKLMDTAFLYLAPAVALASLIAHGKLEEFPRLRIGVFELSAGWVPGFLMHLDGAFHFYTQQRGHPLAKLNMRPSQYFKRQVRVNAFALEGAAHLMDLAGPEIFMWGSDYPHAEGMSQPSWPRYRRTQPRELTDAEAAALGGGNAAFLLSI